MAINLDWAPELLKRLTGTAQGVRADDIEIGDRFIQVGMGPRVWIVERICSPEACDIPHVVIGREEASSGTKIISTATLADTSLYRIDRRSESVENETDNRRRHIDPPQRH